MTTETSRVVVIVAHPDDAEYGAAGTLAVLHREGWELHYVICTDGAAGSLDPTRDASTLAERRRREQIEAAVVVGARQDNVHFLGFPDGQLYPDLELRKAIARKIRLIRPHRAIVPNPEWDFNLIAASHPDHRAVGEAALDAIYPDARNPLAFPDIDLPAWTVEETWIMAHHHDLQAVDITETFAIKLDALHCHQSQTSHLDRHELSNLLYGWHESVADSHGFGAGHLAESFRMIDTR